MAENQPAFSVDTKNWVGDFKNAGREWRPRGDPEEVRVHDFLFKELGRTVPYGIYDLAANAGWVAVGVDNDTAAFAVQTIRRWWLEVGRIRYPLARRLVITADGGGSNGSLVRLWKLELQRLADELGISIEVHHSRREPASGTRSSIAYSRSSPETGAPNRVIVELIGATTTKTGLTVRCELDDKTYPKAILVSDEQIRSLNIQRDDFHGEWNYTIAPSSTPSVKAVDS
jgi:Rhodopirellula transposase DDE domain